MVLKKRISDGGERMGAALGQRPFSKPGEKNFSDGNRGEREKINPGGKKGGERRCPESVRRV